MRFLNIVAVAIVSILLITACGSQDDEMKSNAAALNITPAQLSTSVDPVCNMDLANKKITDTAHYEGKVIPFCNPGCKKAFLENPADFKLTGLKGDGHDDHDHGDHEGHDHGDHDDHDHDGDGHPDHDAEDHDDHDHEGHDHDSEDA